MKLLFKYKVKFNLSLGAHKRKRPRAIFHAVGINVNFKLLKAFLDCVSAANIDMDKDCLSRKDLVN